MKTIVLDPGHGGIDPGAVNGVRRESMDALHLAQSVERLLTAQGQNAVMTRTYDENVTLVQRTNKANSLNADLFVSLHRNSFTNATANGVEVWIYTTAGAVDEAAAGAVLEEISAVGVQSNRGIKKGNYHVLRETNMTSMLVELGFISNAQDNDLFDAKLEAYAEAIAKGICEALGEPYKENNPETGAPKYKVQVGAFADENNARSFLETVRQMGLDAFLVTYEEAKE